MKNIVAYSLITAGLIGASACTNLDEEIKDHYTDTFTPSNPGVGIRNNVNKLQPDDGLQGPFSKLLAGTATNGGFFAVQEGGTDEAVITQKGGDWYDGGLYIRIHHHDFSPQTWGINDCWKQAYDGIYQCNDVLSKADTKPAQVAQLRMLRAYFYWRLMDVFGRVPLITAPNQDVPQSDRKDVFKFIEDELNAAIPELPAGRQEYGRVSQGAAYGLLCRMYLNAQVYTGTARYADAIAMADKVIGLGVYSLDENYAKVFSPDNVDNVEHIFVAPFDEATGEGNNFAQMTLHYPSQLTYKLQSQPWNGFATLEDFYKSYEDGDARKANNFIVGPQFDLNGNPLLDLAYDKADEDGAPLNYTPHINMLAPNSSRQAGARFGKFSFKIKQRDNMDNDFPLIRYGEILLNKAEALQRLHGNWNDPEALALINQIRVRAKVAPFTTMTEGDMLAERGRELFVEAHRRTDLIRFGAYGNAWWEKTADSNPNHNLMAIPIEQMQASLLSKNPLVQNTGY
jgi:hypothetical protein